MTGLEDLSVGGLVELMGPTGVVLAFATYVFRSLATHVCRFVPQILELGEKLVDKGLHLRITLADDRSSDDDKDE